MPGSQIVSKLDLKLWLVLKLVLVRMVGDLQVNSFSEFIDTAIALTAIVISYISFVYSKKSNKIANESKKREIKSFFLQELYDIFHELGNEYGKPWSLERVKKPKTDTKKKIEALLELDPKNSGALQAKSLILYYEYIFEESNSKKNKALRYLDKAIDADPDDVIPYIVKCQNFHGLIKPKERYFDLLQKAINIDPEQPELYKMLSLYWQNEGDSDRAISLAWQATILDPIYMRFYIHINENVGNVENLEEALAKLSASLPKKHRIKDKKIWMAELYNKLGESDISVNLCKEISESEINENENINRLCSLLKKLNRPDLIEATYYNISLTKDQKKQVSEELISKPNIISFYERAELAFNDKRYADVVSILSEHKEKCFGESWMMYGVSLFFAELQSESYTYLMCQNERMFNKYGIFFNTTDLNLKSRRILIGFYLFDQGYYETALMFFNRSLQVDSQDAEALIGKGLIKIEVGEIENAYKLLSQGVDLLRSFSQLDDLDRDYVEIAMSELDKIAKD